MDSTVVFNGTYDQSLSRGTAPPDPRFVEPADERLIHFNRAREWAAADLGHDRPVLVQQRPCRLIAAQIRHPLQILRRQSLLRCHHQPRRLKPDRQRCPCLMEHRAGRHTGPATAVVAAMHPRSPGPVTDPSTPWTHEALGPAQPVQVVDTVSVGLEPRPQLRQRTRVILPLDRSINHDHRLQNTPDITAAKWIATISIYPIQEHLGGRSADFSRGEIDDRHRRWFKN